MTTISGGVGCSTGTSITSTQTGRTYINLDNPINADGIINTVCLRLNSTVYINSSVSITVKAGDIIGISYIDATNRRVSIFRDDGTSYLFIGSGIVTGMNDSTYLGDFVAGATVETSHTGDVITNTLKTSWSSASGGTRYKPIAYASGSDDVYVKLAGNDSNTGGTWSIAKRNIKEGLTAVPVGAILHIGFEDYSAQPGIKIIKNVSLKCETVGGSGGNGTTILPKAAWQQGSYGGDTIIDRSNTNEDAFGDTLCGLGATANQITIYNAKGQRFTPSHRALEKVVLKLKRLLNNDLYVEVRNDVGGAPQGTPQDANKIASVVVPYSSISSLALSEVTITFNQDLGDTNPKWIVVCLNAYNPSSTNTDVSYEIADDSSGNDNEYFGNKCGNSNWLVYKPMNLYFKTYRGI